MQTALPADRLRQFEERGRAHLDARHPIHLIEHMSTEDRAKTDAATQSPATAARKPLPPAAERALAEAAVRRAERDRAAGTRPNEKHGRGGLDPVRYGDWEVKGVASDF
jgi:hypothetical protein